MLFSVISVSSVACFCLFKGYLPFHSDFYFSGVVGKVKTELVIQRFGLFVEQAPVGFESGVLEGQQYGIAMAPHGDDDYPAVEHFLHLGNQAAKAPLVAGQVDDELAIGR